jgi:hypothetical protein
MFRRILPCIGPTGLDFLIGMTGHAIGKSYDQLHLIHPNEAVRLLRLTSDDPSSDSPSTPDPPSHTYSNADQAMPLPATSSSKRARNSAPSAATSVHGEDGDVPVWQGPGKLLYGLTALYGVLSSLPAPMPMALDSPISEITPFKVGCALPSQNHPTVEDIIHTLRQFGNRTQLIVLPETALALKYAGEKTYAVDLVQRDVSEQYGTYVLLSTESPGGRGKVKNEVTLVEPHGVLGTYVKRSLFPSEHLEIQQCSLS